MELLLCAYLLFLNCRSPQNNPEDYFLMLWGEHRRPCISTVHISISSSRIPRRLDLISVEGRTSLSSTMSTSQQSLDDWLPTEKSGYILESSALESGDTSSSLKTARDGHTLLIPQPTSDPNDPLNWSPVKKHLFLLIIAITAFLPDYGSSTGAITNLVQPEYVRAFPTTSCS